MDFPHFFRLNTLARRLSVAAGLLLLAWLCVGTGAIDGRLFLKFALAGTVVLLIHRWWVAWRVRRRAERLAQYAFPPGLLGKVRKTYPHLDERQAQMVIEGLRSYFRIAQIAGGRLVAMPSQAVDVAWHEFILFTRGYRVFCHEAIGHFLHHTPAEHMASPAVAGEGLKRAWSLACRSEGIDPKKPTRLPQLFALDALLAIPDGFRYELDCRLADGTSSSAGAYCASDIGCGSSGGCAGGGSDADGGDGSDGGAGGDGGGGCGGGCGGGD